MLAIADISDKEKAYIQYVEGENERIYHDNLVFSPLRRNVMARRCLILGGGDGLAARTLFESNPDIQIILVDIDEQIIQLHRTHARLTELNKHALDKCHIVCEDALKWILEYDGEKFDLVILDFPDPNYEILEKLYSEEFLTQVCQLMNDQASIGIQAKWDIRKKIAKRLTRVLKNARIHPYTMPFLEEAAIVTGVKNLKRTWPWSRQ
jgi:predicted membrane-bound spermidine synthase